MNASKTVVKSVAVFEGVKATVVLLAGFGVLSLVHRDIRLIAAALVGRFHLNPTHRFAGSFIKAASNLNDTRLWTFAVTGFLYALFHYLEAYGLWFGKVWAEWLAVLSGGILLPLEIYELIEKFTWVRVSAFVVNLIVLAALTVILIRNRRRRSLEST